MSSKTKARKAQRGIPLNLMVVGQSGLGKTTFVNTLVDKDLIPGKDYEQYNELVEKTISINTYTEDIDADGQKVILTVVDTPGFGDNVNNSRSFLRILEYTESQHKRFLAEELRVQRNAKFMDTRVHVIMYFIPPTGHYLRDIDIVFMKQLGRRANILPVVGKSDTMLPADLKEFKKRVMEDMKKHEIPIFDFPVNSDDDEEIIQENVEFRNSLPLSVIASRELHDVDGKKILGRKYPWGIAQVNDDKHCDYTKLKFILLVSHLEVLKDTTNDIHYENYRQECLSKGSLDSSKIEEELKQIEKIEKELIDKETADRERRMSLKVEKRRTLVIPKSDPLVASRLQREPSDLGSPMLDEARRKERKEKKEKSEKSDKPRKSTSSTNLLEDEEESKKKEKKEKKREKKDKREDGKDDE